MTISCKICGGGTSHHGEALVRNQFRRSVRRCDTCGFMFLHEITWLADAYSEAINCSDTGYIARNLECSEKVRGFLELFGNPTGRYLDYAAGYGMLVRLMRDLGYDFRWSDLYCENLFARGFEENPPYSQKFDAITAFEVAEHLVDPRAEFLALKKWTDCIIFSTTLLPKPAPQVPDWWYFGFEHGQHVGFYTEDSLRALASELGLHFVSDGASFHAFVPEPISRQKFKRIGSRLWQHWLRRTRRRNPLTWDDHCEITRRLHRGAHSPEEPLVSAGR